MRPVEVSAQCSCLRLEHCCSALPARNMPHAELACQAEKDCHENHCHISVKALETRGVRGVLNVWFGNLRTGPGILLRVGREGAPLP